MDARSDGMNCGPQGRLEPVARPGECAVADIHLEHGHIYGQCNGLLEVGAESKWGCNPATVKVEAFGSWYRWVQVARSLDEIPGGPVRRGSDRMPGDRNRQGLLPGHTAFTNPVQSEQARAIVARFERKYMICWSGRCTPEFRRRVAPAIT